MTLTCRFCWILNAFLRVTLSSRWHLDIWTTFGKWHVARMTHGWQPEDRIWQSDVISWSRNRSIGNLKYVLLYRSQHTVFQSNILFIASLPFGGGCDEIVGLVFLQPHLFPSRTIEPLHCPFHMPSSGPRTLGRCLCCSKHSQVRWTHCSRIPSGQESDPIDCQRREL